MSRQAEAERERRSRIITADGEFQASQKLASAAKVMSDTPAALQLRLLQTIVEVAAEKNSTLVLPFPVELLRFLEQATGTVGQRASSVETGPAAEAELAGPAAEAELPGPAEVPELSAAEPPTADAETDEAAALEPKPTAATA
jgi:hypothetical protein